RPVNREQPVRPPWIWWLQRGDGGRTTRFERRAQDWAGAASGSGVEYGDCAFRSGIRIFCESRRNGRSMRRHITAENRMLTAIPARNTAIAITGLQLPGISFCMSETKRHPIEA